jgi:hypothetical protein
VPPNRSGFVAVSLAARPAKARREMAIALSLFAWIRLYNLQLESQMPFGGSVVDMQNVECTLLTFAYRRKPDGSIDSICRCCYLTVATADNEAKLHEQEGLHHCAVCPSARPPSHE